MNLVNIRYRYVTMPHAVCKGRPVEAIEDFEELPACPHAIVAYHNRKLLGFLRYETTYGGKRFWAAGTWVHRDARGIGLGVEMWRRVLNHVDPKIITVRTISLGGRRLVGKVMQDADMTTVWHVEV